MTSEQQIPLLDIDNESGEEDRIVPPPVAWFGEDFHQGCHEEVPDQNDSIPKKVTSLETESNLQRNITIQPHPQLTEISTIGIPQKAPSWKELSSQVLPAAASELLSSSMRRIVHTARLSYAKSRWHRKYSDIGNPMTGYYRKDLSLPPFSSLPWIDRQLVHEWRTIGNSAGDDDDDDFENARMLVPPPMQRPSWKNSDICEKCRKPFGPTLLRHHCRLCGSSFCHSHSNGTHKLPHLGYDSNVPERVCGDCKSALREQSLAERVAWRMARCRDYFEGNLTPYFETGVDTVEDVALRVTQAAIAMARAIPLGAQAHVAVETVEVLRKHGLRGIYGLILRKEFLAAADLLCQACDINRATFPLSVHELSAAIFYALAQHRAVRGMHPEREHTIHTLREDANIFKSNQDSTVISSVTGEEDNGRETENVINTPVLDETDEYDPSQNVPDLLALVEKEVKDLENDRNTTTEHNSYSNNSSFQPVCDYVPDDVIQSCSFYAPLALNFVYAEKEVDMQLLAAQQGWRVLYAHLHEEPGCDKPGSALFLHDTHKIACFAVRGTATISDVVTDLKQVPIPFPEIETEESVDAGDWTPVFRGEGLAVSGMAKAAVNLYREHIDVLSFLKKKSYAIRVVGHSLGGGVATLFGTLLKCHFEVSRENNGISSEMKAVASSDRDQPVRVYGYASPSCVDAVLSDYQQSFVTTVVLHDDVVPRLTPTSMRGLVKHLLHIRETWVQFHMKNDLLAITERAKTVWAPRWRNGFTLRTASGFCRKHIQYGKKKILSVKGKIRSQRSSTIPEQNQNQYQESSENFGNGAGIYESSNDLGIHEEGSESDTENYCNGLSKLVVDYMGGIDKSVAGTILDDDVYFDADDLLLENDSDSDEEFMEAMESLEAEHLMDPVQEGSNWARFDEQHIQECSSNEFSSSICNSELEEGDDPSTVVLDETPLPRMFLPGKIVHLYTHRGGYKAAFVPRTFRELRKVSMAGNMLSDHTSKEYFEALSEVQSVRKAEEGLPQWTAFDEDVTCSCCASRFTWASTSDSEAQEARDKHNCRSCGTLCCDPCSRNRIPLPSLGLTVHVRVCDRCYHGMGGEVSENLRSSFMEECRTESSNHEKRDAKEDAAPKKERT
eukprot:CAMPEP_0194226710 /NCGR_PEP_ID=MMETSP0156-20130528/42393_1 /TAXON_ID=33649 /ORGANISM="Thalassionema nitzschioides, Strain L26-B" /LENGTH=1124 /DNA_ID=CAMNT_0038959155 /DNA_START=54 /DNA_END=3424 /DNA_ORIENTATION=-